MSAPVRHFLDIDDLDAGTLRSILDRASELKSLGPRERQPRLAGKTLAMIFDKPSTRTRVSFEVAIKALGGDAVVLNSKDMQLGRGETIADTARVLSRYVDAIMIRTDMHSKLLELAEAATVPVINGLTNHSHPCQIMADVMTFEEHRGPIRDRTLAWVGDGNNVANSWVHAAQRFDFKLRLACPAELAPRPDVLAWAAERQARVQLFEDPQEAVAGADAVLTDVWVSMGDREVSGRSGADGRGSTRGAVHALSAGASRRGGRRRGDRRRAFGRVRAGGEPAARAKGHPRVVSRVRELPERGDER